MYTFRLDEMANVLVDSLHRGSSKVSLDMVSSLMQS